MVGDNHLSPSSTFTFHKTNEYVTVAARNRQNMPIINIAVLPTPNASSTHYCDDRKPVRRWHSRNGRRRAIDDYRTNKLRHYR